jgi:Transposase DDE domain
MFVVAKKGGSEWERTSGAKVRSSWRWPHGDGLPLAVHATSASPHDVSLVTDTVLESFVDEFPGRLIGDNAYDSDPPDEELASAGIEMIAPHRGNKKSPRTRRDACCGDIAVITKWSDCSPGCKASVAWLCDMNTI